MAPIQSVQTHIASTVILLLVCCNTVFHVQSFQFTPLAIRIPKCTNTINERIGLQLHSAAAPANEESFASTWMTNEKRIEDEMDNNKGTESKEQSNKDPDETNLPFGKWEYASGNYILRPPDDQQPRALLHFLGGALLGAAPQLTYRYLLERLARKGYLVVTTPYQLSFDHLKSCDEIIDKFERGEFNCTFVVLLCYRCQH